MTKYEQSQSKNIDPRYIHAEGFRKTLDKIKLQKHMASQAVEQSVSGPRKRPSRQDFANFATEFSEITTNKGEKMYSSILGALPGYMEAHTALSGNLDHRSRQAAVLKTIQFNNALRSSIEDNPRVNEEQLVMVAKAAGNFYQYPAQEVNELGNDMSHLLKGMKHELAFESILWNLPDGFEILETTDEDDARGADYRVLCPNGTTVSIDVKSSQAAADSAYDKRFDALAYRGQKIPANEIILFSGFEKEDFDPNYPWRPTYEATSQLTPFVESELRIASGELERSQEYAVAK